MSTAGSRHGGVDARELRRAFHAVVRRFGLLGSSSTPCGEPMPVSQAHALLELLDHHEVRQGELAAALSLSKSTGSRLVAQLERAGWVARTGDDSDGRAWRLVLTPSGRVVAHRVNEASLRRFGAVLSHVPEESRGEVRHALDVLSHAIAAAVEPAEW